jgi:hypothetical protein
VVSIPLKNMSSSDWIPAIGEKNGWDDSSQYGKINNVPNHQAVMIYNQLRWGKSVGNI